MAERVQLTELVDMLSSSLGKEKAVETVRAYAQAIGVTGDHCTSEEAVKMLEAMAKADGLLGIVARFAKARWYLNRPRS